MRFSESDIIVNRIHHVVNVQTDKNDPTTHFRNRSYYGLALKLSGHAVYNYDGKSFDSTAGTLVFLPKGLSYDVSYPEAGECIAVNFQILDYPELEPFVVDCTAGDVLSEKFSKLLTAWRKRTNDCDYKCLSILYDIINFTQKTLQTKYTPTYKVAKFELAKSYISEHFTDPALSLSEVSLSCGLSEVYIRKLFSDIIHTSPTSYITFLRISYAKDLLAGGESVTSTAAKVGYTDAFYFSKRFHKEVGVSPSQYRAEHPLL